MNRLEYVRSKMTCPAPELIKIVWIKPRSIRCDLATELLRLQQEGSQLTYRDCRWGVDKCQKLLGRRPTVADLDRLGSRLSVPLWLLASAHAERKKFATKQQRIDAAYQLLSHLRAEFW